MNVIRRACLGAVMAAIVVAAGMAPISANGADLNPVLLHPERATEKAPATYRVKVETTSGAFVIEVNRAWAPNGADRFFNLVKNGYYTDAAFFRVIEGFMAQVGMNGDPEIQAAWDRAPIKDDPILKDNTRGMVTFAAKSSPNSRTTQIFINYGDNTRLKVHGKFAPFGKVIEGMEVVDSLYNGYGEGAPRGKGPSQSQIIREGNPYLKEQFPKLDYINSATIIE